MRASRDGVGWLADTETWGRGGCDSTPGPSLPVSSSCFNPLRSAISTVLYPSPARFAPLYSPLAASPSAMPHSSASSQGAAPGYTEAACHPTLRATPSPMATGVAHTVPNPARLAPSTNPTMKGTAQHPRELLRHTHSALLSGTPCTSPSAAPPGQLRVVAVLPSSPWPNTAAIGQAEPSPVSRLPPAHAVPPSAHRPARTWAPHPGRGCRRSC